MLERPDQPTASPQFSAELQAAHERLRLALRWSRSAMWDRDLQTGALDWGEDFD